jgi:hypothetical protein
MAITCKVLEVNNRPGNECLTLTFPERFGGALILAMNPAELPNFVEGATYDLSFDLLSTPAVPNSRVTGGE